MVVNGGDQVSQQNVPNFHTYFEAVTIIMSGVLGLAVSPDLHKSFDPVLFCLHDVMNQWQ